MSQPSQLSASSDLIEALRQLVSVNQEIARSLSELQRLYAEEIVKREAERREMAVERQEWKAKQKQSEEYTEKQRKDGEQVKMPRLPWQMNLIWGLFTLTLILVVLLLAWNLYTEVKAAGGG